MIIDNGEILDIFPTILYLMGNAIPANSAGRILLESFDAEYIARNAIHFVYPSSDETMQNNDESGVDAEFNESQIRALKALGYIGE